MVLAARDLQAAQQTGREHMDRQHFINGLTSALDGNVSSMVIADNVKYYNEYIDTELRRGRSEAEVLAGLGDPRLIARTIIDTNSLEGSEEGRRSEKYRSGEYRSEEYQSGGYRSEGYRSEGHRPEGYGQGSGNRPAGKGGKPWLGILLAVLVVVVVIWLVVSVLSFLAPVLVPALLVLLVVRVVRKQHRGW